jgi:hypothetical protein
MGWIGCFPWCFRGFLQWSGESAARHRTNQPTRLPTNLPTVNSDNLRSIYQSLIEDNKNQIGSINTVPNNIPTTDLTVNTKDLDNTVNKFIQSGIDNRIKPVTQESTTTPPLISNYANVEPKEKPFDVGTVTASILGVIRPQEVKPAPIVPYRPEETTLTKTETAKNEVTNNVPVSVNPVININGQNLSKEEIQSLIVGHFESAAGELKNKMLAKGYNGSSRGSYS